MTQTVLGPGEPFAQGSCRMLRAGMEANRPRALPKGSEPQFEVVRDRHQTPLPGFGFARRHGDVTPIQVNFAPVEPMQFRRPQARKRAESQIRPQRNINLLEQAGDLFRREDVRHMAH